MFAKSNVTRDLLVKSFRLLSSTGRRRYFFSVAFQVLLTFIDLLAILMMALLGSLFVSLNDESRSGPINRLLSVLNLNNSEMQKQLLVVGTITLLFFIIRSILSARLVKYFFDFLADEASKLSTKLIGNYMRHDFSSMRKAKESNTIHALTGSIDSWAFSLLGSFSTILSESILVIGVSIGLLIYEPILSLACISYFSSLVVSIHLITNRYLRTYGEDLTAESLKSYELISNILHGFRDIYTKNRTNFFLKQVLKSRSGKLEAQATISFLPNVGKYILEIGLVLGVLLVFLLNLNNLNNDLLIKIIIVFFVVSSRLTPSLMRIQQNFFNLNSSAPSTSHAIALWESRNWVESDGEDFETKEIDFSHESFQGKIELDHVTFKFEDEKSLITNMSFFIQKPSMIGLIGQSGIGKSTLIDCILGLLEPNDGSVLISDLNPSIAINKWPGAIGYLPQVVPIFDGTIEQNLCFGFSDDEIPENLKLSALTISGLGALLKLKNYSLSTKLGHEGIQLSGGQKQKLGLARALITAPKILIADEPTNALDPKSKREICDSLKKLSANSLILVVTHDSMLINHCDKVIIMKPDGGYAVENPKDLEEEVNY